MWLVAEGDGRSVGAAPVQNNPGEQVVIVNAKTIRCYWTKQKITSNVLTLTIIARVRVLKRHTSRL